MGREVYILAGTEWLEKQSTNRFTCTERSARSGSSDWVYYRTPVPRKLEGIDTMMVQIQLDETSQPLLYKVLNTYTKGNLYCVLFEERGYKIVHKYPLCNIFRVVEDYNKEEEDET